MGYSNDEEHLRPSTPDAEETLPLYEESQRTGELKLPNAKAGPQEVRDFLVDAMQSRGAGIDHARRVAARWTLGTGRDLRAYPVAMYRDIFGAEDGWAVCMEAKTLLYREKREKEISRRVWIACLVATFVWIGGAIGTLNMDSDEEWKVAAQIAAGTSLVPTVLCIIFFASMIFAKSDPETTAEQELQREWYKMPGAVSRTD